MATTKFPKYLTKRKDSNVWQLRVPIPASLQIKGKSRLHRESLGETDLTRAKIKRDIRVGELREEWQKQKATKDGNTYISDNQLRAYAEMSQEHDIELLGVKLPIPSIPDLRNKLKEADHSVRKSVGFILRNEDIELNNKQLNKVYGIAKEIYLRDINEQIDAQLGVVRPKASEINLPPLESINSEEWNSGQAGSLTIVEAIALYQQSTEWNDLKKSSQNNYILAYSILKRCFDSTRTVGSLNVQDYERIHKIFTKLPYHLDVTGQIDNLIAQNESGKVIAAATINRHLTALRKLFLWLEKQTYIKSNLAALHFKSVKKDVCVQGIPFTEDDIKIIFNKPVKDLTWWGGLIGLFTGMRIGEVCQLRPEDIIEKDGIWCISNNDEDENNLKAKGSFRLVPIHSKLIEAGFIKFAQSQNNKNGRIFKELKFDEKGDYWRRIFSRRFEYRLDKLGLKPKGKIRKSFHSFRYLMTDRLIEKDISPGLIDELLGWESSERKAAKVKMRKHYSGRTLHETPIQELKAAIETVQYDWLIVN